MFNGIIYNTGKVHSIIKTKNSLYIGIQSKLKFNQKEIGSSVCCDGACLTLTEVKNNLIYFYISNETLKRTNFKLLKTNHIINLEKSILYGQNISGHFIQGHVDTVAKIIKLDIVDKTWILKFKILNKDYSNLLLQKASISINGVSLTISKCIKNYFEINVIPHTLKLTNLKNLKIESLVNVELDIFSKYIQKYSV
ncbi:riboflavin synthase [Pelagibacteraceae bacterium]|jgi:riboflavin synthase|nr:riboflavin synthase [Pelagibacteraceae bacterium]